MTPWPTGVPKGPKVWEYEDAEVIGAPGWGGKYIDQSAADAALAECAEVIERLCVCGNCENWGFSEVDDGSVCCHDDQYRDAHENCNFTPSRWTPYRDAEQKAADA